MKNYMEISPLLDYPQCYTFGLEQDCFSCELQKENTCSSPRAMCVNQYYNHPRGCPNYGKRFDCPPQVPFYNQIYIESEKAYFIWESFDLECHVNKMRAKHPEWTEPQLYNVLYWQGTVRKKLKDRIVEFYIEKNLDKKIYGANLTPEALGIDMISTMRKAGIDLIFPAKKIVYKIAVVGKLIDIKKDKYCYNF